MTDEMILLVEDDAAVRLSFQSYLEDSGYRVLPAGDGEQGIGLFRQHHPDLCITDLRMPKMDGLEVLRLIRQEAPDLPVIVVSGAGTLADSVEALRLGAWDYLIKPVSDLTMIRHAVSEALEKARLRSENNSYREHLEELVRERTRDLEMLADEARHAAEQLRIFCLAVEQSSSAVLIADIDGRIEYVNRRFSELTGYSKSDVIGRNPRILRSKLTPRGTYLEMWQAIRNGRVWRGELLNRRKNGDVYWEQITITPIVDDEDEITHFLAVQEDISERKEREASLLHMANHDSLTGLPNRLLALDRLDQSINLAEREAFKGALLYLDLDGFKAINDGLGHEAGDRVLIEVSERLRQVVRKSDTVARIGGDEYLVILQRLSGIEQSRSVAGKILSSLLPPIAVDGASARVSASIGVVIFPDDGRESRLLLRSADTAMYSAKQWGKNRVVFFSEL